MIDALNGGLDGIERPLGATDSEIEVAIAEAGLLPLVMSTVHMTGRMDLVRSLPPTLRPQFLGDPSGSVPEDQAMVIRAQVVAAVRAWRDAGCPKAYRPTEVEIREMIDVLAGKQLDARYVPLLTEELGMEGDARAFRWERPQTAAAKAKYPVLIIGAGLSGIAMGYRLKQAGIPFTIVEKNSGPGGTWFENRYPGARVDVPSLSYSFSFVRRQRWPELFSPAPVLRSYFETCVDILGLRPHIRFGTEVLRARYDAVRQGWEVVLKSAAGQETVQVRAVASAVGQLNRALIPDIPGAENYRGVRVHTSRWPEDLSVRGKKVAVIGTAATALQLVPEMAGSAAHLTVFQRSPPWVFIHKEYRRAVRPGERWAMDHLPGYNDWHRVQVYNWAGDGAPETVRVDPHWKKEGSVSEGNEAHRKRLEAGMLKEINSDPALAKKIIPNYPPGVKRPNLGDGGFFRALTQDNVDLVTDGIERFTETGLFDRGGRHHEADIVVYATGFRAQEFLSPMEIVGRDGVMLNEFWKDEPGAHIGITVPHFPNLFLMYGPGTNLPYNGTLFFHAECQAHYIAGCLRWMVQDQLGSIEVKDSVYLDYAEQVQKEHLKYAWSSGATNSWYKNNAGKVIANSPWPLVKYWEMTRRPDPADFNVETAHDDALHAPDPRQSAVARP